MNPNTAELRCPENYSATSDAEDTNYIVDKMTAKEKPGSARVPACFFRDFYGAVVDKVRL